MSEVNAVYLKDENGNIISPITSSETIFSASGGGYTQFLLDKIYPIGSIYLSINSTNPSTLFGGTWEQLKDRFLLGTGDTYSNGSTGGEATHKLTVSEIPSHTHSVTEYNINAKYELATQYRTIGTSKSHYDALTTSDTSKHTTSKTSGSSGSTSAHNNMPPYLTVYMWKRIS